MARYGLGSGVRVKTPTAIVDATGTAINPSTIKLTVKKPDGTTQDYTSPTNDGTGLYHQDVPKTDLTTIGHYSYWWTATTPDGVSPTSTLEIYDPGEVTILALQDAKDMLNKSQLVFTDDNEVLRMIATIQASLEKAIGGPVITRTITNERLRVGNGYRTLTVRYRPLVSVTSITDVAGGASISLTDIDVDYATGVIRRKLQLPFWSWGPFYLVTYTAGLGTAVPPAITTAALLILANLWQSQTGGAVAVPGVGGDETVTLPGWGYAIPQRAAQLLSPYALEAYF
jgi:hypothetical protein